MLVGVISTILEASYAKKVTGLYDALPGFCLWPAGFDRRQLLWNLKEGTSERGVSGFFGRPATFEVPRTSSRPLLVLEVEPSKVER